jgi:hypothetical protein
LDGFDAINKLSWFPKKIYPFLPVLLFLFRQYFQIKIICPLDVIAMEPFYLQHERGCYM